MSRPPASNGDHVALEVLVTPLDARGEPLPERQYNRRFATAPITIGEAGSCDLVLPGLPRLACRIEPRTPADGPTRYVLVRPGQEPRIVLNGTLLTAEEAPLANHSQWQVGNYRLRLVVRFRPVLRHNKLGHAPAVALVLAGLALLVELSYLLGMPRWVPVTRVLARETTRQETYSQLDRLRRDLDVRVKAARPTDPPGTTAMLLLVHSELSRLATYLRAHDAELSAAQLGRCRLDVETLAGMVRDLDSGHLRLAPPPLAVAPGLDHLLTDEGPRRDP